MPFSENHEQRPQPTLQPDGSREDRISQAYTMYPVFCTANIPSKLLDEFIEQAYEGCFAMVDDGEVGASPCILDTTDLSSITHGSRKPMPDFDSPFIGKTDNEIRQWMKDHKNPNFAECTFIILNEDTIKNKTCRVGHIDDDKRILLTDFYTTMVIRVPIEMATLGWESYEYVGDRVYNRAFMESE